MVFLYILAALTALVLLLLFLPIRFRVQWSEEKKRIYVGFLFLRFPVYPPKPKKEKPEKAAAAPDAEPHRKPFSLKKLRTQLTEGAQLVRELSPFVRRFCRAIRVPEFSLRLALHSENPAVTALEYGAVSAAFGILWEAVNSLFIIPSPQVEVLADFKGEKTSFSFHCRLWSNLYLLLRIAIPVLKILLPRIQKTNPAQKQGA